jgi:SAM-dependent methyltransferase
MKMDARAVLKDYLAKMRTDWDRRARENSRHFIANGRAEWSREEFYESGEATVSGDILSDMYNICQDKDPKQMRVLEIGCGAGRVTRALAQVFGEVHAVDVSGEMLQQAREALAESPNAFLYQTDGATLDVLGERTFDFAYSCCVFHHISSYEVIRGYVSGIGRRLVPGGLFKFEVQGCTRVQTMLGDTWIGVPFSEMQAGQMAEDCGFELRYHRGAGEERFWLWFFKELARS